MNDAQRKALVYLDLIAAKSAQLASDIRSQSIWPEDLKEGVAELSKAVEKATQEVNRG